MGIDRQLCLQNLAKIKNTPGIQQKLQQVYELPQPEREEDADHALYTGGFFSDQDKAIMERIRSRTADELVAPQWQFEDPRLDTLLFRYRARNFPHSLTQGEIERWQRHRQYRFLDPASPASIKLPDFMQELESLMIQHAQSPNKKAILNALYQYAENL